MRKYTGKIALICAVVFFVSIFRFSASAQEYQYGDFKFIPNGSTATITGFCTDANSSNIKIPSSVSTVISEEVTPGAGEGEGEDEGSEPKTIDVKYTYTVTAIADSAFYGTDITSVTIPSSVNTLGSHAFAECPSLSECIFEGGMPTCGDGVFDGSEYDFAIRASMNSGWSGDSWNGYPLKLSHTHVWSDWVIERESTCTQTGLRTRTCSICNETQQEEIPMKDHSWGAWVIDVDASTSKKIVKTRTCSVCGKTETIEEDSQGVDTSNPKPSETQTPVDKDPNAGTSDNKPSVSQPNNDGHIGIDQPDDSKMDHVHVFGDWITVTEPTYDQPGLEKHVCTICGAEETRVLLPYGLNDTSEQVKEIIQKALSNSGYEVKDDSGNTLFTMSLIGVSKTNVMRLYLFTLDQLNEQINRAKKVVKSMVYGKMSDKASSSAAELKTKDKNLTILPVSFDKDSFDFKIIMKIDIPSKDVPGANIYGYIYDSDKNEFKFITTNLVSGSDNQYISLQFTSQDFGDFIFTDGSIYVDDNESSGSSSGIDINTGLQSPSRNTTKNIMRIIIYTILCTVVTEGLEITIVYYLRKKKIEQICMLIRDGKLSVENAENIDDEDLNDESDIDDE